MSFFSTIAQLLAQLVYNNNNKIIHRLPPHSHVQRYDNAITYYPPMTHSRLVAIANYVLDSTVAWGHVLFFLSDTFAQNLAVVVGCASLIAVMSSS